MTEIRKKVDESWKEQVEKERLPDADAPASPAAAQPAEAPAVERPSRGELKPEAEGPGGFPEARFDLFVSSLAMEALIAMGEVPHPATNKRSMNLEHSRYLIDVLGILEEKTRGNTTADEAQLLKDTVYQLRMRYLSKAG